MELLSSADTPRRPPRRRLLQAVANLETSRGAGFYQTQLAYTTLRDMYASMGRSADATAFGAKIEQAK